MLGGGGGLCPFTVSVAYGLNAPRSSLDPENVSRQL